MAKRISKYNAFWVMVILPVFLFGCAVVSTETKVKCPKCGATLAMTTFTADESLLKGSVGWRKSR